MDIAGVICCVSGMLMFTGAFISARSRLRLLRSGTAVKAIATRIIATSQSLKGGRTIMNVRYEFTTDTGKTVSGFYKTASPPTGGGEIRVVYDPRRP